VRKAGADEGASGSLIPLPNDYVVPGGRFREVYYWDSYFTLLGLQTAGKDELVRDMVENFAYLIDEVGHIPNGNRTYYLTRSQPPFFSLMVEVLAEMEGKEVYREFYPQLEADTYLYDEEKGFYQDLNWTTGEFTNYLSLAGVYPLFVGIANDKQAAAVGDIVAEQFMAPGGVRTSLVTTGEQWDAPNGWPPLQWMTYQGLKNYGEHSVAQQIRERWMANNERVYANVHKMVEKYNVEDISLEAGGGEYPVQDGFGWSNGVYLRMSVEK